jgi:hypothetical protein
MKKLLSFILVLMLLLSIIPMGAVMANADTEIGGQYGKCSWSLVDGVLTVSGKGDLSEAIVSQMEEQLDKKEGLVTEVIIETGITFISHRAFWGYKNLKSISIPNTVTRIGGSVCAECVNLTSVIIPESVKRIGDDSFWGCKKLSKVTLPDSLEYIGGYVFENTELYENEKNWENGALYIGNYLFDTKEMVSGDYKVKDGTRTIRDGALSYCKKLKSVTIPASVVHIGYEALTRGGIESINVSSKNKNYTSVDGVLFSKDKSELVKFPSGRTGDYKIPKNVELIGKTAFMGCSLTSVSIPIDFDPEECAVFQNSKKLETVTFEEGVEWIDMCAFNDCTNIKTINLPSTIEMIEGNAFSESKKIAVVNYNGTKKSRDDIGGIEENKNLLKAKWNYTGFEKEEPSYPQNTGNGNDKNAANSYDEFFSAIVTNKVESEVVKSEAVKSEVVESEVTESKVTESEVTESDVSEVEDIVTDFDDEMFENVESSKNKETKNKGFVILGFSIIVILVFGGGIVAIILLEKRKKQNNKK